MGVCVFEDNAAAFLRLGDRGDERSPWPTFSSANGDEDRRVWGAVETARSIVEWRHREGATHVHLCRSIGADRRVWFLRRAPQIGAINPAHPTSKSGPIHSVAA